MLLPGTSLTKTLATVLTLVGFDVIVDRLDMVGENWLLAELDSTCRALVILLVVMHSLEMPSHAFLPSKPLPTLLTLVEHTFMDHFLVPCKIVFPCVFLVTTFN